MFGLVMNPIPSERMKRKAKKSPKEALFNARAFAAIPPTKSRRRFADGRVARRKLERMNSLGKYALGLSEYEQRLREKNAQRLRDVAKE